MRRTKKIEKAKGYKHMMFREAATLARGCGEVGEMWLTHFSPSLIRPDEYMDMVRGFFRMHILVKMEKA